MISCILQEKGSFSRLLIAGFSIAGFSFRTNAKLSFFQMKSVRKRGCICGGVCSYLAVIHEIFTHVCLP